MPGISTTESGRKAEKAASVYLEMRGYKILEKNWRRPNCEIDIIAKKHDAVYFVEVKYRAGDDQGSGFEAIIKTKLKQMQYAADNWIQESKWVGEYSLAAVEISGKEYAVFGFIDNVY
jgi:putative endonuclease